MREFVVKMIEPNGRVLYLAPNDFWVYERFKARLFAKSHAGRVRNSYRYPKGYVLSTEVQ